MRNRRRLFATFVGLLSALAIALPVQAAAAAPVQAVERAELIPPARYCDVRIDVLAQWANGYAVSVTVTNISDVPVTVSVSLPIQPPGYIVQAWNATVTVSGDVVWIRPWNPVLAPGQSINFGYVGSGQLVYPDVTCQPAA